MEKKYFGQLKNGEEINVYTLDNGKCSVKIMDRGATITEFKVYGIDIVGGFDTLEQYLEDTSHQGAVIGRIANRVANAKFTMDGKVYNIPNNDHGNCLHGGDGFDHKKWKVTEYSDAKIVLEYRSFDGEEGFPGALKVTVTYSLVGTALVISYRAVPEAKTPISLTNHAYFNLDGFGGNIEEHTAIIHSDCYTEVDDNLIPNGNRPSVKGTAFDFTEPHKIGERLDKDFIGYDHNFMLKPTKFAGYAGKTVGLAAEISGKELKLNVYTDQEGIQFYIGNFLGNGPDFKGGVKQVFHGAFCLETQTEPNSVNQGKGFYDKGEVYTHTTVYQVEKL